MKMLKTLLSDSDRHLQHLQTFFCRVDPDQITAAGFVFSICVSLIRTTVKSDQNKCVFYSDASMCFFSFHFTHSDFFSSLGSTRSHENSRSGQSASLMPAVKTHTLRGEASAPADTLTG